MAGGSALVLLIDEIATMVKVTAEKTEKVKQPIAFPAAPSHQGQSYFKHDTRFIFDIAKGSLKNKVMLVPAALALNYFLPWAVLPLVAAGGVYFSRAGIKKLRKTLAGEGDAHVCRDEDTPPSAEARTRKIKEALRTDMILSAEITAITLALVATMPFAAQAAIMSGVAAGATVAAYSVITGLIKMEDLGGWMANRPSATKVGAATRAVGRGILNAKPAIMNAISTAGSIAIFMVGGGLMFHGIPALGGGVGEVLAPFISSPYVLSAAKLCVGFFAGLTVGATVYGVETAAKKTLRVLVPAKQRKVFKNGLENVRGLVDIPHTVTRKMSVKPSSIRHCFGKQAGIQAMDTDVPVTELTTKKNLTPKL